ncbi:MAG TPA: hypothetical protein VN643_09875 [Pyrinomonadaceae bacterium]|nr:hypothetical protein [Pyrinomonadaceae bacterium]
MNESATSSAAPKSKFPVGLILVILLATMGMIAYSQTVAYFGDESLHLVAGQLIAAGKKPYIDFFYQHTPLWAYLVGLLVFVFGESWRVVHFIAALFMGGALMMVGAYVHARATDILPRFMTATMALLLLVENAYVVSYGVVALPYSFCLFFMVTAFVLITSAVKLQSLMHSFAAGACAGAAAASYLLTAPLIPVLLVWLFRKNKAGSNQLKSLSFLLGAALPFTPLLWLFARAPNRVWFDLVKYHLYYRSGRDLNFWFNVREIAGWFISIQGLMLTGFALVSLFLIRRHGTATPAGDELRLSAWIAAILSVFISVSRPVSSFYFVLITPFLAIPAAFGIAALHLRVRESLRFVFVLVIIVVYAAGMSAKRYIWQRQTTYAHHYTVNQIARIVDEVTAPTGMIYAFEAVYFEAHRLPPAGLENRFNPESTAEQLLKDGRFDTVCISATNPRLRQFNLLERYRQQRSLTLNGFDFYVLWDKRPDSNSTALAGK